MEAISNNTETTDNMETNIETNMEVDVELNVEIENLNIEPNPVSTKKYNIDKILSYDSVSNLYSILWEDGSITQEPKENIDFHAIKYFNIIENHNATIISSNEQNQTAYVMIRSSVKKDSSIETQRTSTLEFCKNHNLKLEYYTEDNGVSGRFNNKKNIMNNLNYEFGYRLNSLKNGNVLVVNSIDRIGRHSETVLKIIENLMSNNISLAIVDLDLIITPKLYELRNIKMLLYEHSLKSQELSDEISRRVLKAIRQRKEKGIIIQRRKPKGLYLQRICTADELPKPIFNLSSFLEDVKQTIETKQKSTQ